MATTTPKRECLRVAESREGLAWARAWRARNKPAFDALYGPELCPSCGGETRP